LIERRITVGELFPPAEIPHRECGSAPEFSDTPYQHELDMSGPMTQFEALTYEHHYWKPKFNGIPALCVVNDVASFIYVYDGDSRRLRWNEVCVPQGRSLVCQYELVGNTFLFVQVSALYLGRWRAPLSWEVRQNLVPNLFKATWRPLPELFNGSFSPDWEGVIFSSRSSVMNTFDLTSPSGLKVVMGRSRHVKAPTIDVRELASRKILELSLSGQLIRERPDKLEPNDDLRVVSSFGAAWYEDIYFGHLCDSYEGAEMKSYIHKLSLDNELSCLFELHPAHGPLVPICCDSPFSKGNVTFEEFEQGANETISKLFLNGQEAVADTFD